MTDFETRRCSVCGSAAADEVYAQSVQPVFEFPGFQQHVQLCRDCGFVYVSPSPSEELLSRYYRTLSNYENPQTRGRPTAEDQRKHDRALGMILDQYGARPPGRALDIGCAVPYSLGRLRAEGWTVVGTDPSPQVAEIGRELYDVEVRTGLYQPELFSGEPSFDVVIMSHVLEHLVAPVEVLRGVSRSLDRDGLLYVEVPDLLHPDVPFGYFTFEHLNYFTPRTLVALLAAAGFAPITLATFDNVDGTWPFYPVIASVSQLSDSLSPPPSDHEAAAHAVATYRESSASEGQRLRDRVDAIVGSIRPGRLALWGAGIHTTQLLTLTGLDPSMIACVYDNDPKKQGRLLLGRPVRALPADPAEVARDVDAILISSRAFEAAIQRQIAYLEDHGVSVHPLYKDRSAPESG